MRYWSRRADVYIRYSLFVFVLKTTWASFLFSTFQGSLRNLNYLYVIFHISLWKQQLGPELLNVVTVADPGFPVGGRQPRRGVPTPDSCV